MGLYKILAKKFTELNADRPLSGYTSLEFEQSEIKNPRIVYTVLGLIY
jgi:hypothetical protein